MRLSVCKVRQMIYDDNLENGTLRTSYVYGPTAREYAAAMASNDGMTYKILSVEDVHGYEEEGGRRRQRAWWETSKPPTHYFFNEHLSREPLSGDPRAHNSARGDRTAGEVYDEQMGEVAGTPEERPADADGGSK